MIQLFSFAGDQNTSTVESASGRDAPFKNGIRRPFFEVHRSDQDAIIGSVNASKILPKAVIPGYITEGQIVLDRPLNGQSIYPPINILPSLSRLMKDGIGEGYTREDHQDRANQLFSAYAKVGDARNLASVIGEDELSPIDKKYLEFGKEFEEKYIGQGMNEKRTMEETLDLGWKLLGRLPREELDRVDTKILDKYYKPSEEE